MTGRVRAYPEQALCSIGKRNRSVCQNSGGLLRFREEAPEETLPLFLQSTFLPLRIFLQYTIFFFWNQAVGAKFRQKKTWGAVFESCLWKLRKLLIGFFGVLQAVAVQRLLRRIRLGGKNVKMGVYNPGKLWYNQPNGGREMFVSEDIKYIGVNDRKVD